MDSKLTLHPLEGTTRDPSRLYQAFVSSQPTRVLLVDEDADSREPLAFVLRQEGYDVTEVVWVAELFDYLREPLASCMPLDMPELIIADLDSFSGPGGREALAQLSQAAPTTRLVLLSSDPDVTLQPALTASYVLDKPCTVDDVRYTALSLVQPR